MRHSCKSRLLSRPLNSPPRHPSTRLSPKRLVDIINVILELRLGDLVNGVKKGAQVLTLDKLGSQRRVQRRLEAEVVRGRNGLIQ